MEKLEQVDIDCVSALECAKIEVCIEIPDEKIKPIEKTKVHEKPVKSRLSKLFKKSRLNAKYVEELIPVESLKYRHDLRIYEKSHLIF
ncbi:MAG: hypothetical protein ACFE94_11780 [Candidatus Hodarchaeota archaeon]